MRNGAREAVLLAAVAGLLLAAPHAAWSDHPGVAGSGGGTGVIEVTSKGGMYRVAYQSRVVPVPINQIHSWVLTIKRADGTPVTGASATITGDMPAHGHGLPTKPRLTRDMGGGEYLVEGMKFQMPGEWLVDFDITANGERDTARFRLGLGGSIGVADTHDHAAHGHHQGAATPIGVMGDHTHGAGGWMLTYRYMHMGMSDNRDGTDRMGTSEVLQGFMVAPTEMAMDMHMFGGMYGATDDLTLMLMLPYLDISMDHVTRMGVEFTTTARGLGDASMTGIYRVWSARGHDLLVQLGLSLPTGSIDQKDNTPAGDDQQLPYPMQLGSGTFDLLPGVTYKGTTGDWSWGVQGKTVWRQGHNSRGYRLGNRHEISTWAGIAMTPKFSTSLRLRGLSWGNIDGEDSDLNPGMVPTADPDRRAGRRLDGLLGLSYQVTSGWFSGTRWAAEGGIPFYQDLDGPQLESDWVATVGVEKVFH